MSVKVIDGLLTEDRRQAIDDYVRKEKTWEPGWKSDRKNDVFWFWHKRYAGHNLSAPTYDCADELKDSAPIIYDVWLSLADTVMKGHTLVRCYANGMTFGNDGSLHTDSKAENSFTSVYYPHAEWFPNWGGATEFFNADKTDIIQSVYPRPNRLCMFSGRLLHRANGVSRTCPVMRVTLMWKTECNVRFPT